MADQYLTFSRNLYFTLDTDHNYQFTSDFSFKSKVSKELIISLYADPLHDPLVNFLLPPSRFKLGAYEEKTADILLSATCPHQHRYTALLQNDIGHLRFLIAGQLLIDNKTCYSTENFTINLNVFVEKRISVYFNVNGIIFNYKSVPARYAAAQAWLNSM